MSDQDRDWLDQKLNVEDYIPDGGFTAQVISQLPKTRLSEAEIMRRRILILFGFFSLGVATGMTITETAKLVLCYGQMSSGFSLDQNIQHFAAILQQPMVMCAGAACMILLTIASVPLLRRWV